MPTTTAARPVEGAPAASPRRWMQSPFVRLAVTTVILLLSYFPWLPMPWRQPVVGLLAMGWIILETGGMKAMGLGRPSSPRATLGWALLGSLAVIAFITPVIEPLLNRLTGTTADYSIYGPLLGNLPVALNLIGQALLSAAIGEELIYRGFLLHQLSALGGDRRAARVIAVLAGAAVFGLAHAAQGLVGAILTGLAGVVVGAIFFVSGRNLWALMLSHAIVDIWGVATLYFRWY